jgi:hypothetical protein
VLSVGAARRRVGDDFGGRLPAAHKRLPTPLGGRARTGGLGTIRLGPGGWIAVFELCDPRDQGLYLLRQRADMGFEGRDLHTLLDNDPQQRGTFSVPEFLVYTPQLTINQRSPEQLRTLY